jgi:hypothetical protein
MRKSARRANARTSSPLKIRLRIQLSSDVNMLTAATNATAPAPRRGNAASPSMSLAAGGELATT